MANERRCVLSFDFIDIIFSKVTTLLRRASSLASEATWLLFFSGCPSEAAFVLFSNVIFWLSRFFRISPFRYSLMP